MIRSAEFPHAHRGCVQNFPASPFVPRKCATLFRGAKGDIHHNHRKVCMTTTTETEPEQIEEPTFAQKYVDHLNTLRENGGAMAALRRGLGKPPGTVADVHPYVLRWIGNVPDDRRENAFYIVASLFALWHQGKEGQFRNAPGNLGASLGQLKDESDSTEKRFVAMLNSHIDDLSDRLRHAVSLLAKHNTPVAIDWAQLVDDLQRWDSDYRSVQRKWARGFWKTTRSGEVEESANADAGNTES